MSPFLAFCQNDKEGQVICKTIDVLKIRCVQFVCLHFKILWFFTVWNFRPQYKVPFFLLAVTPCKLIMIMTRFDKSRKRLHYCISNKAQQSAKHLCNYHILFTPIVGHTTCFFLHVGVSRACKTSGSSETASVERAYYSMNVYCRINVLLILE